MPKILPYSQPTLDNLCYQYRYDQRDRLIAKHLPGKGWEETIYNRADQVVFTQDGNQRAGNTRTFTKYDNTGRVIMTGIETGQTATRADEQTAVNAQTTQLWETRDPAGYQGYSSNSLPLTPTDMQPLTVNYYDSYTGIPGLPVYTPAGSGESAGGLLTASKTYVLNPDGTYGPALWKIFYYDDKGRVSTTYIQHYLNGTADDKNYDEITNTYDFNNEVTATLRKHYTVASLTAATPSPALTISTGYTYDHMGRKRQTREAIAAGTGTLPAQILLSQLDYNDIGQLQTKRLHSTDGMTFMQRTDYAYNERGWLKSSTAPLFAMILNYNDDASPQYNGNIASQYWGKPGSVNNSYSYTYDNINRLTAGIASTGNSETGITYDKEGNIKTLNRSLAGTLTDQLTYNYTDASSNPTNQLQSITDATSNDAGVRAGTSNYAYADYNGNTTTDASRSTGSNSIAYNLLNLPASISGTKTIAYTYDATGQKLRRISPVTGSTDYISGIQYEGGTIRFVQTDEGRALNLTGTTNYEYTLSDNLGNSRVTFDSSHGGNIAQQTDDYLPFGLVASQPNTSYPPNDYLYNKKELQEELGVYDYGARQYDPVIARFTTIDPLAEFARRHSSYEYAFSNPLRFVDPTGMSASDTTYSGGTLKQVNITATKTSSVASTVGNFIVDNLPFVGSGKQLYQGIRDGNWKEATLGAVFLTVDVFTAGEGGEGLKLAEEGAELATAELLKVGAEDEIKEGAEKSLLDIAESDKIDRDLLDAPTKPGDAPKFKSDGKSVEIHHEGQKAEGPFKEMHPDAHRGKGNYSTNHPSGQKPLTAQARKEFNAARRAYWKKEFFKSK